MVKNGYYILFVSYIITLIMSTSLIISGYVCSLYTRVCPFDTFTSGIIIGIGLIIPLYPILLVILIFLLANERHE
jgi:hypothetical protein